MFRKIRIQIGKTFKLSEIVKQRKVPLGTAHLARLAPVQRSFVTRTLRTIFTSFPLMKGGERATYLSPRPSLLIAPCSYLDHLWRPVIEQTISTTIRTHPLAKIRKISWHGGWTSPSQIRSTLWEGGLETAGEALTNQWLPLNLHASRTSSTIFLKPRMGRKTRSRLELTIPALEPKDRRTRKQMNQSSSLCFVLTCRKTNSNTANFYKEEFLQSKKGNGTLTIGASFNITFTPTNRRKRKTSMIEHLHM